mgnify:CR=1 FL=1
MGNRVVSQAIPKVDYKALVTGKAVYTDDLAAKDSLVVKVLRSPHAHALIQDINLTRAELVPDIECILTYKDCPDKRFTMAGQTYPEPSPYDRLILDQRVRFVGDAVAIVAGETEAAVDLALKRSRSNIRWKHRSSTSTLQKIIRSWCTRRRTGNSRSRLAAIIRETYVLQQGKNMVM